MAGSKGNLEEMTLSREEMHLRTKCRQACWEVRSALVNPLSIGCQAAFVDNSQSSSPSAEIVVVPDSTHPKMVISHSYTLSSSMSPAEKPSTGCFVKSDA